MTALAIGCGRPAAPATHSPPPTPAPTAVMPHDAPRSSVNTVIDGLTGRAAGEAGKKARGQLEQIGKQEQHDINETMQP